MENHNQDFIEQRIFPRYTVNDSSAVMLVPGEIISYYIVDISRSGMSFCYYGKVDGLSGLTESKLTLFVINDGSFNFSVQIVSDSKFNQEQVLHVVGESKNTKPYC